MENVYISIQERKTAGRIMRETLIKGVSD